MQYSNSSYDKQRSRCITRVSIIKRFSRTDEFANIDYSGYARRYYTTPSKVIYRFRCSVE